MQDTAGAGDLMGVEVAELGEAVRMRGGEPGIEEQEDTGDDGTSISMASSASPSPSTFAPASATTVAPHLAMGLHCADWTLQKWPAPSNGEGWCQQTGVSGETGLEGVGEAEGTGEERQLD